MGIIKHKLGVYLERHFSLEPDTGGHRGAETQSDSPSQPARDDKLKCFNETKTVKARMKLIAALLSPCQRLVLSYSDPT